MNNQAAALKTVLKSLQEANENGLLVDTLWTTGLCAETLFDYLEREIDSESVAELEAQQCEPVAIVTERSETFDSTGARKVFVHIQPIGEDLHCRDKLFRLAPSAQGIFQQLEICRRQLAARRNRLRICDSLLRELYCATEHEVLAIEAYLAANPPVQP